MNLDEIDLTGQSPNYTRRRFDPCPCDSRRGYNCVSCRDDDGTVAHGGVEYERLEHESPGYPRRA